MKKRLAALCAIPLLSLSSDRLGAEPQAALFSYSEVSLLEGPFRDALRLNGRYVLEHDMDRLLAPFLSSAGLEPRASKYGNWESSGLDGHSAGHFLSALALHYAATREEIYRERLDYMVAELGRCQAAHGDGYVGGIPDARDMWREVARGELEVDRFAVNGRWVPWYNLHKTFAGLKDAWTIGGNAQAREILVGLADWCHELTRGLDDEQMQRMLYAEHGGMNDVFADMYQLLDDERYLALAHRFSHRELLEPLLAGEDPLTGMHANTQIPKVIGFQRVALSGGKAHWSRAARAFWDNVVEKRSVAFGGNSAREHFHSLDDFDTLLESREGPESCNTHNMLRLTAQLFLQEPQAQLVDYYERALFNHIQSVQHPKTGGLVYFTPIRPSHYRVYSQAEQAFWCCVGSGIENPGRATELIYARSPGRLLVNLFLPSELRWKEQSLRLTQQTDFPREQATRILLELERPKSFTLSLRRPSWAAEGFAVTVNGKAIELPAEASGYLDIKRRWRNGDRVEVSLPMNLQAEQLPDGSPYYAFLYGPIVLAAAQGDSDTPGLFAGDGRMEHIAPGAYYPLERSATLVGPTTDLVSRLKPVAGQPLRFQLEGDIRPEPGEPYLLKPFHQIHGERYTLYWRALPEADYASVLQRIEHEEARKREREARVVDAVASGEQQPEVEHGYLGEESRSGTLLGKAFREASGWFEYTLDTQGLGGLSVSLTYWGSEWGRACKVLVDGVQIGSFECNANEPERFVEEIIAIPEALLDRSPNAITVRVQTLDGRPTPSIFEVALLR